MEVLSSYPNVMQHKPGATITIADIDGHVLKFVRALAQNGIIKITQEQYQVLVDYYPKLNTQYYQKSGQLIMQTGATDEQVTETMKTWNTILDSCKINNSIGFRLGGHHC